MLNKKMKKAKKSFGKPYDCKKDWPDDCFVQCGDLGVVFGAGSLEKTFESENPIQELKENLKDEKTYTTAFFEAFPKKPSTFIRGEGKNIEEAENNAWEQLQKYLVCKNHEFERRNYKNGAGFCKHCGLFNSKAFEPLTECCICGKPTNYSCDNKELWYCEEHDDQMPEENKTWWRKHKEKKMTNKKI